MQSNIPSPIPFAAKDISIGRSYEILEYALKENKRDFFYPLMFRNKSALSAQEKEDRELCIQEDCELLVQVRLGQLMQLVPADSNEYAHLVFLKKYTIALYRAFYASAEVPLASIFASQEEMETYLSLMKEYLYEGYWEKQKELGVRFVATKKKVSDILDKQV